MKSLQRHHILKLAILANMGLMSQMSFAQYSGYTWNSGDYTVPPSHPGFTTIITQTNQVVGTLTIPSGSSLVSTSIYAPYSLLAGASISTINNQGLLDSSNMPGLLIEGNVGKLINNGTISSGIYHAIEISSNGVISTLTNTGTLIPGGSNINIVGISNAGTITTLNNAQNDLTSQNNLTYSGNLPSTYQVIIHSLSDYGEVTFNAPNGVMNFGIGPGSRLLTSASSYSSVLTNLSSSNLLATSGTIGGGVTAVTWLLSSRTTVNGTEWDLSVNTPQSATAPKVHSSQAGTKQIAAITTTYNYAMAGGVNQSLAGGNSLTSAVQSLTTAQVNQFTNAHAEGYSSNMTIGLEQMAHITNSVMDRIHAPKSNSANAKVYQDDQGRYVWADIAAAKGMVNNNNNLAGFGYNLYDLILGMDIHRTKEGGYGVYAGVGGTSMTESQQVTQNFNNTNFYTGIYGAHNFDEQLKLSGALGYMYGSTSANRNTPDIGLFTGGNATSSYNTNGVYGAAKLAKAYQFNDVTISPFIGASYSQLWMGRATEQGGNDFNFVIGAATAYTAVTFAGFDFVYPIVKGVKDPLSLVGFYKFGYDWFANNNGAHSITATSPIYGSFTQVGANMGPISNLFALGLQGQITEGISSRIGIVAAANTYGRQIGGGAEIRVKF